MKIDILDEGYWSPKLFWGYQVMTSMSEMGFGGPGKRWGGLMGHGEGANQPTKGLCAPPNPSHVTRRGGGATPRAAAPPGLGGGSFLGCGGAQTHLGFPLAAAPPLDPPRGAGPLSPFPYI